MGFEVKYRIFRNSTELYGFSSSSVTAAGTVSTITAEKEVNRKQLHVKTSQSSNKQLCVSRALLIANHLFIERSLQWLHRKLPFNLMQVILS